MAPISPIGKFPTSEERLLLLLQAAAGNISPRSSDNLQELSVKVGVCVCAVDRAPPAVLQYARLPLTTPCILHTSPQPPARTHPNRRASSPPEPPVLTVRAVVAATHIRRITDPTRGAAGGAAGGWRAHQSPAASEGRRQ